MITQSHKSTARFLVMTVGLHEGAVRTILTDFRHAIDHQELCLHYQSKSGLTTERATGVNALIGWVHPDSGRIHPLDFIPLADETGLIVPIGESTERLVSKTKAWKDVDLPLIMVVGVASHQPLQPRAIPS